MREKGFETVLWTCKPSKRERDLSTFRIGAPASRIVVVQSSKPMAKFYLLALVFAEELGLESVVPGYSDQYYRKLLSGLVDGNAGPAQRDRRKKKKKATQGALQPDDGFFSMSASDHHEDQGNQEGLVGREKGETRTPVIASLKRLRQAKMWRYVSHKFVGAGECKLALVFSQSLQFECDRKCN